MRGALIPAALFVVCLGACRPAVLGDRQAAGVAADEHASVVGPTTWGLLGARVLSAGDVDGDGIGDVVASAPGSEEYGWSAGEVLLYRGRDGSLDPAPAWTAAGQEAHDRFGQGVAVADFDGDGLVDVAVSAPGAADGAGTVAMYRGLAGGFEESPTWQETGEAGQGLGFSLASAGDVDGDGRAELLVGVLTCPLDFWARGALLLAGPDGEPWSGGAAGGPWQVCLSDYQYSEPAVAGVGDVDGDGYDDLAVGDPGTGEDLALGALLVWHGGPEGPFLQPSTRIEGVAGEGDLGLGEVVAGVGDVNGDGFADVLVGEREAEQSPGVVTGAARLYPGSPAGLQPYLWANVGGAEDGQYGGSVQSLGDLNGDGFADLGVGAPAEPDPEGPGGLRPGVLYVYLGSDEGPAVHGEWTAGPGEDGDSFGSSAAAADLDGDGFPELVVGAAQATADYEGRLYVFDSRGDRPVRSASADGSSFEEGYGDAAAGLGDLDGDGFDDLAVGAPGRGGALGEPEAGSVDLHYGSASGPSPSPVVLRGEAEGDRFGASLAGPGDVDCDGWPDLLVGGAGAAWLFPGGPDGPDWDDVAWSIDGHGPETRVAGAGDVDGDGCADLLVGAPRSGGGEAFLFLGGAGGPAPSPDWTLSADGDDDRLGEGLASLDSNGDGFSDVLVGAPSADSPSPRAGLVFVFPGGPAGLGEPLDPPLGGIEADTGFGSVVASVGDLNRDGYGDFALGMPLMAPVEGYPRGGGVRLYLGGPIEPVPQDWSPPPEGPEVRLGAAIASAGDADGDGYPDLLISDPGYGSGYDETQLGRIRLYRGGPSGPEPGSTEVWEAGPTTEYAALGWVVASAGDVDGDGLGDFVATTRDPDGEVAGRVEVWLGGRAGREGGDLGRAPASTSRPTAVQPEGGMPIPPGGGSDRADGFDVSVDSVSPFGRTRGWLEVEVKAHGVAFDGTGLIRSPEQAIGARSAEPTLRAEVRGLDENGAWHWRARIRFAPTGLGVGHTSRWLYGGDGTAPLGVHVRTPCALDADDNGICDQLEDLDGDGWVGLDDCDDGDPAVHPAAVEVCAAPGDEDCSGLADADDPACWWGCDCAVEAKAPERGLPLALLLALLGIRARRTAATRPGCGSPPPGPVRASRSAGSSGRGRCRRRSGRWLRSRSGPRPR